MATRPKVIAPDESVQLKLTADQRNAVVDCLYVIDPRLQDRVGQTPAGDPIPYNLEELEDLHGMLAADANHTDDAGRQRVLDKILRKIEQLLESHTDGPQVLQQADGAATSASPQNTHLEEVPAEFRNVFLDVVALTDKFCDQLLNEEYQQLCRLMAVVLCQPESPVVRGKRESWASGIVYTVGWVNFLGDPNVEPYVRSDDIAKWFGISKATMQKKSKILREGLDLMQLDPKFTLPSRLANNPLVWMFEVDGMAMDIRAAPREVQQLAYEQGLIPFIPADGPEAEQPYAVMHQRLQRGDQRQNSRSKATDVAYQIKITLDGSKPPIWRRLRVPDCTLQELHDVVQLAMGWMNCHLHEFQAGKERFSSADMDDFDPDDEASDESNVRLSDLVEQGHKKLQYWYDFGDDWRHTIAIEKTLDAAADNEYPTCTAGARACPPEDVGGIWGYYDLLEALADTKHDRHEELVEWLGDEFDPEEFDVDRINQQLSP